MDLTLLVLAAGMGSRYGGLKQMDPMGPSGETVLDYSVYDALQAGFNRVCFVIRRDFDRAFQDSIGSRYASRAEVSYVYQELSSLPGTFTVPAGREKPWGTGHAIWTAAGTVTTPFLAINADDFYGRDAFVGMAEYLGKISNPNESGEFAMTGYKLANTLSEHGSVSRGVCEVNADGLLQKVEELTKIEKTDDGIVDASGELPVHLTGDEVVSMNFWGFTPVVFPLLEKHLVRFLEDRGKELKSEFYIPSAVMDMTTEGEATVRVLRSNAQWFGVTYREDKPRVTGAIAELIRQGAYPENLWD